MQDIIGVQLEDQHKQLVLHAVGYYRAAVHLRPDQDRALSEIQLHLENEDSDLIFLESTNLRINMEDHMDLLEIPRGREG